LAGETAHLFGLRVDARAQLNELLLGGRAVVGGTRRRLVELLASKG